MLKKNKLPDQSTLLSLFEYKDGHLLSRRKRRHCTVGGSVGCLQSYGYVVVKIGAASYYAHRLVFKMHHDTDAIDTLDIDHINGVRDDNRIENLRLVDRSMNTQNLRGARKNNKTGFLGVSNKFGRYVAQIRRNGKYEYLGLFDTPEEAHATYLKAKRASHAGCTI